MSQEVEKVLKTIPKEDLMKMSFVEVGLYLQMLNKIKKEHNK